MYFKGTTHAYLLKMSMTHNKNQNPLLYLLINCISTRSAPKILSLKDYYNLRLLNFLIIDLCNSATNCWFDIFSFLIAALPCVAKVSDLSYSTTQRLFFKTYINH